MAACSVGGFLPLKCPLAAGTEGVDEGDTFTVSMFMERQISAKRSVGLCIDLTSPSAGGKRLYESTEWDDWDVAHVGIPCAPPVPATAAASRLCARIHTTDPHTALSPACAPRAAPSSACSL